MHDLDSPEGMQRAIEQASARLLGGTVDKKCFERLRGSIQVAAATGKEYPWREVLTSLLADSVDEQRMAQQALQAQRDWILRGGRETPKSLGRAAKGLLARFVAQLLIFALISLIVIVLLLALKYRFPEFDIYRVLAWAQGLVNALR